MPSPTFTLISSYTVGSGGAAQIEFTSIPQIYSDLCIKFSGRSARNDGIKFDNGNIKFNGSTSSYSNKFIYGWPANSSTAASGNGDTTSFQNIYVASSQTTTNTFGNTQIYVVNYTTSNNKEILVDAGADNNSTASIVSFSGQKWASSAPVTSIQISAATGNLLQFSEATLYGIKNS
jgi:hypothetical protein